MRIFAAATFLTPVAVAAYRSDLKDQKAMFSVLETGVGVSPSGQQGTAWLI